MYIRIDRCIEKYYSCTTDLPYLFIWEIYKFKESVAAEEIGDTITNWWTIHKTNCCVKNYLVLQTFRIKDHTADDINNTIDFILILNMNAGPVLKYQWL